MLAVRAFVRLHALFYRLTAKRNDFFW